MPYAGYVGADSFSYAWSDELSPGNIATVQIEVYNNLPYAYGDTFYVQVGEVLIGQLDGYDPDGDSITATLVSGPSHGILELHPDGSFLYTPEQNYLGVDRFSYGWSDGVSESASVHVNLVLHDGESPVAFDVSVSVRHSRPVYSRLQGYDPNGDVLTATLEEGPAHGTVVFVNPHDGTFIYTPTEGYVGPDSFTYKWSDGTNTSNVARVTLSVYNDAPVAQGEFFMLQPGQSFAVFLGDSIPDGYEGAAITVAALLDNDWDPNGDALELVVAGNLSERWHFDSELHAWVFTAPPEFSGVDDSFEYFVTDRIPVNRPYSDTYNEDETYPYSASWRVCMLLQVGGGGGGARIEMYFADVKEEGPGWTSYKPTTSLRLSGLEGPSAFVRVNDKVVLRNDYVNRDPKRFILRINDPAADRTPGPGNDQITAEIRTVDKMNVVLDRGIIVLHEKPDAPGQFWSDNLLLVAHPNDDSLNIPVPDNQLGDPTFLGELEGTVRAIYRGSWVSANIPAEYSLRIKSVLINWNWPVPLPPGVQEYDEWVEASVQEARCIFAPLGIKLELVGGRTKVEPQPPSVNLSDEDGLDDLSFEFDSQNKIVPNGAGELHNLLISYREQDPKVIHVYIVNIFKSTLQGPDYVAGVAFSESVMSNPRLANSVILAGRLNNTDPFIAVRRLEQKIRIPEFPPEAIATLAHELTHVLLNSPVGVNDHLDPKEGINAVNLMSHPMVQKDPTKVDYPRRIFPVQQERILKSNLLTRLGQ